MQFICEPLFEVETPQQEQLKQRSLDPVQCEHCGEWSENEYLHSIRHGRVFNGWCSQRLFLTNRVRAWRNHASDEIPKTVSKSLDDDIAWLESKGFDWQTDPHDKAYWV